MIRHSLQYAMKKFLLKGVSFNNSTVCMGSMAEVNKVGSKSEKTLYNSQSVETHGMAAYDVSHLDRAYY